MAIYDENGKPLFQGERIVGPATVTYQVGALPAGSYHFQCDLHPTTMRGDFVVE